MRKTQADESNPDLGKIKTVQFIAIIKKVGLMNQAPAIAANHFIYCKKWV